MYTDQTKGFFGLMLNFGLKDVVPYWENGMMVLEIRNRQPTK
jgi:hypothetical protein